MIGDETEVSYLRSLKFSKTRHLYFSVDIEKSLKDLKTEIDMTRFGTGEILLTEP